MKPISRPPAAGRSDSLSGAGEESWAEARGRSMKNRVSALCAARCKRRKVSPRAWLCQNRSAPQLPLRRTCSAAHSASVLRLLRIQISCDGCKPIAASASAWGGWGGCKSTMRFLATFSRAGRSRRNSPMPGCWGSKSIRVPVGQPLPGSWDDKVGWPVSMQRAVECASCEASHREGCKSSGEAWELGQLMVVNLESTVWMYSTSLTGFWQGESCWTIGTSITNYHFFGFANAVPDDRQSSAYPHVNWSGVEVSERSDT